MLELENTVLVLVDVQGKLAQLMYEKDALFENLCKMIRGAKVLQIPILWLEQIPENLGPTVPEVAQAIPDGLQPISKSSFSGWGEDRFVQAFKSLNRGQVLITGIETHICVYQTAADLLAEGQYEVQVVADCVSSRTAGNRDIGLEKIRNAGGFLTSVETVLFELQKKAEGPEFKELIRIVK